MVATAIIGSTLASGYSAKKSADKAAKAQTQSTDENIAFQERMADRQIDLLKGAEGLSLQDLMDVEEAGRDIYTSARERLGEGLRIQGATQRRVGQDLEDLYKEKYTPVVEPGLQAYKQVTDLLGVSGDSEAQSRAMALLEQTPGYQFQKREGIKAITQQQAAKGIGGGSRLKAIGEFVNNLATQNFNQRLGQLGGLAQDSIQNLGTMLSGADANLKLQLQAAQTRADKEAALAKLDLGELDALNQIRTNLVNTRFKGAGSQSEALGTQAVNVGNLINQRGEVLASSELAKGKATSDALSTLGGLGYDYFSNKR